MIHCSLCNFKCWMKLEVVALLQPDWMWRWICLILLKVNIADSVVNHFLNNMFLHLWAWQKVSSQRAKWIHESCPKWFWFQVEFVTKIHTLIYNNHLNTHTVDVSVLCFRYFLTPLLFRVFGLEIDKHTLQTLDTLIISLSASFKMCFDNHCSGAGFSKQFIPLYRQKCVIKSFFDNL